MTDPQVDFVVHGVSMSSVPISVTHEGKQINATVDCLEVELTGTNGRTGSVTLKFIGDEIPAVVDKLKSGAKLSLPIAPSPPGSPVPAGAQAMATKK
jgi:hypothetical protein